MSEIAITIQKVKESEYLTSQSSKQEYMIRGNGVTWMVYGRDKAAERLKWEGVVECKTRDEALTSAIDRLMN